MAIPSPLRADFIIFPSVITEIRLEGTDHVEEAMAISRCKEFTATASRRRNAAACWKEPVSCAGVQGRSDQRQLRCFARSQGLQYLFGPVLDSQRESGVPFRRPDWPRYSRHLRLAPLGSTRSTEIRLDAGAPDRRPYESRVRGLGPFHPSEHGAVRQGLEPSPRPISTSPPAAVPTEPEP